MAETSHPKSALVAFYLKADLTSAFINMTNDRILAPSPTPQQPSGDMQGMAARTEAMPVQLSGFGAKAPVEGAGESLRGPFVHAEVKSWLDEFEFHQPISGASKSN